MTWHTIDTAPCNDTFAWVRWQNGQEQIIDFDHDSTPAHWAKQGATHWREATPDEMDAFWEEFHAEFGNE